MPALGLREAARHRRACSARRCRASARPWPSGARSPRACRRACGRWRPGASASTATPPRRSTTRCRRRRAAGGVGHPDPRAALPGRRRCCAGASRSSGLPRRPPSTRGSSTRCRRSPRSGPALAAAGGPTALDRRQWRRAKRLGFSDAQLAYLWGVAEAVVRATRAGARCAGHVQDRRHVRRRVRRRDAVPLLDLEDDRRGAPAAAAQGGHPRVGAEPHRPGHRVRLLLRPRQLRPARRRLRDGHGQLQPRDRLHRLRHLATASTSSR